MENFATKNQTSLLNELEAFKGIEEAKLKNQIGIVKQVTRDSINGIDQAVVVIKESLAKLRDIN